MIGSVVGCIYLCVRRSRRKELALLRCCDVVTRIKCKNYVVTLQMTVHYTKGKYFNIFGTTTCRVIHNRCECNYVTIHSFHVLVLNFWVFVRPIQPRSTGYERKSGNNNEMRKCRVESNESQLFIVSLDVFGTRYRKYMYTIISERTRVRY